MDLQTRISRIQLYDGQSMNTFHTGITKNATNIKHTQTSTRTRTERDTHTHARTQTRTHNKQTNNNKASLLCMTSGWFLDQYCALRGFSFVVSLQVIIESRCKCRLSRCSIHCAGLVADAMGEVHFAGRVVHDYVVIYTPGVLQRFLS